VYDEVGRHRDRCIRAGAENGQRDLQVLIASSRAVTRRALKGLLQTRPDLVVVAEAADAQEMLEQAEANSPDVVLLDSGLFNGPQENLVASLRQLEC
jgi:DNA-binding NarL/FixJ family response regulator